MMPIPLAAPCALRCARTRHAAGCRLVCTPRPPSDHDDDHGQMTPHRLSPSRAAWPAERSTAACRPHRRVRRAPAGPYRKIPARLASRRRRSALDGGADAAVSSATRTSSERPSGAGARSGRRNASTISSGAGALPPPHRAERVGVQRESTGCRRVARRGTAARRPDRPPPAPTMATGTIGLPVRMLRRAVPVLKGGGDSARCSASRRRRCPSGKRPTSSPRCSSRSAFGKDALTAPSRR